MNTELLIKSLAVRGINITQKQVEQLVDLMDSTLATNERFNLTAIKDKEVFMEKMIFDSAIALNICELTAKTILDLGTGAGFPGLVLYILNPKINLILLDSTQKKITYLKEFCASRDYHVNCICARGEEYSRLHREEYDYVIARGVSNLSILMEISMPMVKVGGGLIAMKALSFETEISQATNAFKKLHCRVAKVNEDYLPECDEQRNILLILKDKITNKVYPRDYKDIKTKNL